MKHTMVSFHLHKKGVVLIVVLSLIVAILLVAAGYLWGRSVATAALGRRTVAEAPKTAPVKATTTAGGGRLYTLRVGIEPTEDDAKVVVKSLAIKKIAATVAPVETSSGTVIYEIHSGTYPDRAAAAKAATALQEDFRIPAAVVPAP